MLCQSPVMTHDSAFSARNMGMPVTLSNSGEFEYPNEMDSPKRAGFMNNLFQRRNSLKKETSSPKLSPRWPSIFSKKNQPQTDSQLPPLEPEPIKPDEVTAMLIQQLQLEGRSEEEINMHLSYIHDSHNTVPAAPEPAIASPALAPAPAQEPMYAPQASGPILFAAPRPASPTKRNAVSQFFRDVKQALVEEFSMTETVYYYEPVHSGLTINISTAPFYGALPPDMDMSYEQLAALEPVYVGAKCSNSLPTCTHDGTPLPGDQTNCPVCLGEFTEGECLKSLPCVHFFHKDCIDSWLMVGHTCPVCKSVVE